MKPTTFEVVWTLDEARCLCSQLESEAIPLGLHIGLGGSVLHKGFSKKDLDIFVYSHSDQANCEGIRNFVSQLKCKGFTFDENDNGTNLPPEQRFVYSSNDYKGKRIDMFFMVKISITQDTEF